MNKKTIYFVSDHTGITIEAVGKTLLSQFPDSEIDSHTVPYIDTTTKALDWIAEAKQSGDDIVVFSSILNLDIRELFAKAGFQYFDLFNTFLPSLENIFEQKASRVTGAIHGVGDYDQYMMRIEAINYALAHDDGLNTKHYKNADIVLVGVSRSGKTPTCLYMAIQFGIKAANYPITDDDLGYGVLPKSLEAVKDKVFGLLINPQRLHEIRSERMAGSQYASIEQCKKELKNIEQIYRHEQIPYLNTTSLSIEEISTQILLKMGIEKRLS